MKNNLKVLVINRTTKEYESIVKDVFQVYGRKYDLLIFPPKENSKECLIQVVSFKKELKDDFSEISNQHINDEHEDFYDFDLEEIELDTFYDMLNQRFEIETFNLTDVEK
jgi:hypothetical protein